jgi:predicted nucleic acid-binding Zn ribbon protein
MNPLSKVLEDALRHMERGAGIEARAVMLWPEIVGPQIAAATEAQSAREGVLVVVVRDSAWSTELGFRKAEILRAYDRRLSRKAIREVRFRVGKIRGRAPAAAGAKIPPDEEVRRIRLSDGEIEAIRRASEGEDPELSQAIRRALTREAQLRTWNLQHGAKACPRCGAAYRTAHALCPACRQDDATAGERL